MKQFKQLFGGKSLEESVEKSRGGAFSALRDLFRPGVRLDEDFWEELEDTLIMADVGPYLADELTASKPAGGRLIDPASPSTLPGPGVHSIHDRNPS